ncbi:MAG: DUF354 domain-containing protein [Methanobacteriaceae archaeon]|nr:DUF354 domain-containing protein [Methanobacteriaceae archaeon]
MKIWIDIVNTPHVHFFHNIIKQLEKDGHEVIITTRKFSDIQDLLDILGLNYTSIGKHGVTLKEKLLNSTKRAYELSEFIINQDIDIAIAKHSIEMPRVAFGLKIPNIFILDNEHAIAANKLTLPLVDNLIIPEILNVWDVIKAGADPNKIIRYNGTCEITHIDNITYNDNIFEELELNLKKDKTILMRPEPSLASYLDADCTKSVLTPIIESLKDQANILVLPRFKEQSQIFKNDTDIYLLKTPLDTFSLMKKCDLIIGAGGTMNREAALIGTPVISCYPGKQLAVDKYYEKKGLLNRSLNLNEIIELSEKLLKKSNDNNKIKTDDLKQIVLDTIYSIKS